VRVAVNGYGVIGKRVVEAIAVQDDMRRLIGIVHTGAKAHIERIGEGFRITRIELDAQAEVPEAASTSIF